MQANTPSDDFSKILTQYWQISLVAGYSALYGKVVALLRCVVVETTIGSPRDVTQDQLDDASTQRFTAKDTSSLNLEGAVGEGSHAAGNSIAERYTYSTPRAKLHIGMGLEEDKPEIRRRYRKIFGIIELQVLLVLQPIGTAAGVLYYHAEQNANDVSVVQVLRYAINVYH